MCYLCLNGTTSANHSNKPVTLNGNKVSLTLRHLEDTYEDDWKQYGSVDLTTGTVEFSFDDYTRVPSIFVAKQLNLPIGMQDNKWNYDGLPDAPEDDEKTQLLDSAGNPLTQKCHWPTYKDYLGLSESFKYCTKCGKEEKKHE